MPLTGCCQHHSESTSCPTSMYSSASWSPGAASGSGPRHRYGRSRFWHHLDSGGPGIPPGSRSTHSPPLRCAWELPDKGQNTDVAEPVNNLLQAL